MSAFGIRRVLRASNRFAASSRNRAARIRKYYRREAAAIHPPVDVQGAPPCEKIDDHYLVTMQAYRESPALGLLPKHATGNHNTRPL